MKAFNFRRLNPGSPAIALTLTDRDSPAKVRKAIQKSGCLLPLLLEIRIDRFRSVEAESVIRKLKAFRALKLPLLATLRARKEGGSWPLSEQARIRLFKKVLPWADLADLEADSTQLQKEIFPLARKNGKKVILSHHDFKRVPEETKLRALLRKGKSGRADFIKIAVLPVNDSELVRFLLFVNRWRKKNIIAVAMGDRGRSSRVLGHLIGSLWTYCFLSRSHAPGQFSLNDLWREMKVLLSDADSRRI